MYIVWASFHNFNQIFCDPSLFSAMGCPLWTLHTPGLGKKECKEKPYGWSGMKSYCSMKCLKYSQFVVQPLPEYTCTEGAKWEPDDFVPDCVSDGRYFILMAYFGYHFH